MDIIHATDRLSKHLDGDGDYYWFKEFPNAGRTLRLPTCGDWRARDRVQHNGGQCPV